MPISGPASYLPTTDEFIAHWNTANTTLGGADAITLAAGITVENLSDLRENLSDSRAAVEAARNSVELARADLEARKAALLDRLNQFNLKLASLAPDTLYMKMRPKAYSQSDGMGKVLPPLDDLADLWQRYDTAVAPLTLMGGYTRATYTIDLAALKNAYPAHTNAKNQLAHTRGQRNETQETIRTILRQYRQRIPAEFPEGSANLETLPRLTPPEGSTPDPATLSGAWTPAENLARLDWILPPDDPSITALQLRATTGPEYDTEDETVILNLLPTDPPTWTGLYGLTTPGSATTFKLYTQTPEGNEHGSNPITITRPLP